jgi:hypothetical protein
MTLAAALTALTITVWPQGLDGDSRTVTLRCAPAGGTHHSPVAACRRLMPMTRPFRPIPEDAICTQIYGGPQVAFVRGTFKGARVWARFHRRNGCEIGRWDRLRVLLGAGGASAPG